MILLEALWFFLPAGLANMAPILAKKIRLLDKLDYPVDFYKKFQGKRIFGNHKTIRGFVAGMFVGVVTVYLQTALFIGYSYFEEISLINYLEYSPLILGLLFSLGALGGDAVKSFFKRRANVKPGRAWFPFDQFDYIIGGLLLSSLVIDLSLDHTIMVFVIWTIMHPLATTVGYLLKLKDSPI